MSRRRNKLRGTYPPRTGDGPLPAAFRTRCPSCGKRLDEHDGVERNGDGTLSVHDKAQPYPGAFSICLGCGEPARYGPDGHLRRLTPDDETDITPDTRLTLLRIQSARVSVMFSCKAAGKDWLGKKL